MWLTSSVHSLSGEVSDIAVMLMHTYLHFMCPLNVRLEGSSWVIKAKQPSNCHKLPMLHWEYRHAQHLVVGLLESEDTSKHRFLGLRELWGDLIDHHSSLHSPVRLQWPTTKVSWERALRILPLPLWWFLSSLKTSCTITNRWCFIMTPLVNYFDAVNTEMVARPHNKNMQPK